MCGIIGIFGRKEHKSMAKKGVSAMRNRGLDGEGYVTAGNGTIAQCLHSVVGAVKQPIIKKGILSANCEIYNWKELCAKHSIEAANDSEMLAYLIEKIGVYDAIKELDGVFAFAYLEKGVLWLARDIIGVKPLWFSHADGLAFASEKKALEKSGYAGIEELNPRKIIEYNTKEDRIMFHERKFFSIKPEIRESKKKIVETLKELITDAVKKRVPDTKFGVLFSGGVDSTLIASILRDIGADFTCYTAYFEDKNLKEPQDLVYAGKAADYLSLNLKASKLSAEDAEKHLKKIIPLIEDSNAVKAGVAITFHAACMQAKNDGCRVIFSGLGSEELFGGYERHKKSSDINMECISGLLKMYERDTYRDDTITMNSNLELRLPFLDKKLAEYSLRIPSKYKIEDGMDKKILRDAASELGVPGFIVSRKKKAAQYGSNFHKALQKLASKRGFKKISPFLREFYPGRNARLAALVSSGKDSIYSLYVMQRQNYEIGCIITMKSKNPDSFMYHTPSIDMAKLQAEAMGIPIIIHETGGEKEAELEDLKKALEKAKKEYSAEGVVTGALFSNYQRERIEMVADSLGMKIFSPLWHSNQETYMRQVVSEGFEFIMTKVMAEGLDKSWLNRKITQKDIDLLASKKGFNTAGEGGEYETLVTDCPIFRRRISIKSSEIMEESRIVAELLIKKAELAEKQ